MLTKPSHKLSKADIVGVLDQLGGTQALREETNVFRATVARFWNERDLLIEKYPNTWVAMGVKGGAMKALCPFVTRLKKSPRQLKQGVSTPPKWKLSNSLLIQSCCFRA